ncbi:RNase adapter RapZ [bacterium]|nr:MAG: RNase adapter RapZ [bacterium]
MGEPRKDNRFLIVTGLSGSGKTVVSRFLEDLGYYCVDNLPAKLIPNFVDLWQKKKVEIERVALVVDIREPSFLADFPRTFREVRRKISPRLIFLDASDESLVKRFSESRRPHPLSKGRTILEGVRSERLRMAEIMKLADEVIDTSDLNISQLKDLLTRKVLKKRSPGMQVVIVSFGYKYGLPLDSDLVLDTRFLPNPFYIDRLRNRTGKSDSVRDYVLHAEETKNFLKELIGFIDRLIPRFVKEGKSNLTISIGCTGGKHRSVVVAEELRRHLKGMRPAVKIYHRDIYK